MPHFTVVLRIEYARALNAPKLNELACSSLYESVDAEMTARGFVRKDGGVETSDGADAAETATATTSTSQEPDLVFANSVATLSYTYVGDVGPNDVMVFVVEAIGLLPFNMSIRISTDRTSWQWVKSAPQEATRQPTHGRATRLLSVAHAGNTVADAFARILLEWCIVLRGELAELPFAERAETAFAHFSVLDDLIASDDIRHRLLAHARATRGMAFADWLEGLMARRARAQSASARTQ